VERLGQGQSAAEPVRVAVMRLIHGPILSSENEGA